MCVVRPLWICLEQACHQLQLRVATALSHQVLEDNSEPWRLWSQLNSAVLGGKVPLCLAGPPKSFKRKPRRTELLQMVTQRHPSCFSKS